MKKLNLRGLKKQSSMLIWKNKKKNFIGLSLSIEMNMIKSTEDLDEILAGAFKALKFLAEKELKISRTENEPGQMNRE